MTRCLGVGLMSLAGLAGLIVTGFVGSIPALLLTVAVAGSGQGGPWRPVPVRRRWPRRAAMCRRTCRDFQRRSDLGSAYPVGEHLRRLPTHLSAAGAGLRPNATTIAVSHASSRHDGRIPWNQLNRRCGYKRDLDHGGSVTDPQSPDISGCGPSGCGSVVTLTNLTRRPFIR